MTGLLAPGVPARLRDAVVLERARVAARAQLRVSDVDGHVVFTTLREVLGTEAGRRQRVRRLVG